MGPKLRNRDLKGQHNFAEQLQCATKILQGGYEREASTTAKMKLIAEQLPDSLINKWADVSYSIREKGQNPGVEDLAKFVKRQAALRITRDLPVWSPCQHGRQEQTRKNHPIEQKYLRIQGKPHPLLIISLRKTQAEGQEQVMDRVNPYSEYRAVCIAQVHMNWPHASSSKTKICKPAEIF